MKTDSLACKSRYKYAFLLLMVIKCHGQGMDFSGDEMSSYPNNAQVIELLNRVVQHQHVVQRGLQNLHKRQMVRVRQVDRTARVIGKGEV